MKRKMWMKDNGFSLVELIIAIAILVILTGLLAPQFMRYMEKSRAAVCVKNRDEMLNIYKMEYVSNIEYSIVQVIKDNEDKEPCPSDGIYTDGTKILNGISWIFCSEHDKELLKNDENTILSDFIYDEMVKFTQKTNDEINKATGMTGWQRNDTLRAYLWQKNGNKWPEFSDAYKAKYGGLNGLYIQPYMNVPSGGTVNATDNDVTIFAATNNTASGNWNASCIYNKYTQTWYQNPPGTNPLMIKDLSWDQIWGSIEKTWVPLK